MRGGRSRVVTHGGVLDGHLSQCARRWPGMRRAEHLMLNASINRLQAQAGAAAAADHRLADVAAPGAGAGRTGGVLNDPAQ